MQALSHEDDVSIRTMYEQLVASWNHSDARAFASKFADDGLCIGFDGTEYTSRAEIAEKLSVIFKDHQVASYVFKIREVKPMAEGGVRLKAVASMIPPDGHELNPKRHVLQTLVAVRQTGVWRIVQYQNTPIRYDGRPEAVQALTDELSDLIPK